MEEIIISDEVKLRKFKMSDALNIFNNWMNDEDVSRFLTWIPHKSVEETKELLISWLKKDKLPETHRFAIALRENDEVIGSIDVCRYDGLCPQIGYELSKKYWNKGYMSKILVAFRDYLLSLGHKVIDINADELNIGSNLVIIKSGFMFKEKKEAYFETKNLNCVLNTYSFYSDNLMPKKFTVDLENNDFNVSDSPNKTLNLKFDKTSCLGEARNKDYLILSKKDSNEKIFGSIKDINIVGQSIDIVCDILFKFVSRKA